MLQQRKSSSSSSIIDSSLLDNFYLQSFICQQTQTDRISLQTEKITIFSSNSSNLTEKLPSETNSQTRTQAGCVIRLTVKTAAAAAAAEIVTVRVTAARQRSRDKSITQLIRDSPRK